MFTYSLTLTTTGAANPNRASSERKEKENKQQNTLFRRDPAISTRIRPSGKGERKAKKEERSHRVRHLHCTVTTVHKQSNAQQKTLIRRVRTVFPFLSSHSRFARAPAVSSTALEAIAPDNVPRPGPSPGLLQEALGHHSLSS